MANKQPPPAPEDHGGKQGGPPKAMRWQKGQSGNPGGRPKGKSLLAEIRDALNATELGGKPNKGGKTNKQVLAERAIFHAGSGRSAYFRAILEWLYPKPAIRVESSTGEPDGVMGIPDHVVEAGIAAMLAAAGEDGGPKA